MAQNKIVVTTTPPLPGTTLVSEVNAALQSLATGFAGNVDPASVDGVEPYVVWVDTLNGLTKRRNAAGTDWVVETRLFEEAATIGELPWRSKAIGELIALPDHIPGTIAPPTNNENFRYIKLTASDAYNTGALSSEAVTGSAPLVVATAVISLAGSPINGATVHLINTERRSLRAGSSGTVENDQMQTITGSMQFRKLSEGSSLAGFSASGAFSYTPNAGAAGNRLTTDASGAELSLDVFSFSTAGVTRSGAETRSKNIGVTYYMRIK